MSKAQKRKERRAARDEKANAQRLEAKARRRRKLFMNWSIIGVALLFIVFIFMALGKRPAKYTDFATCLSESGTTMYGTDWCPHCQDQKRLFGRAFKDVDYVNCDYSNKCALNGVQSYPTWIYPDGERATGVQELEVLAEKSGCELP